MRFSFNRNDKTEYCLTWQGHDSCCVRKSSTQDSSQALLPPLQSRMHSPSSMLLIPVQFFKLSRFCEEGSKPQTQIGLGQSSQPLGH